MCEENYIVCLQFLLCHPFPLCLLSAHPILSDVIY